MTNRKDIMENIRSKILIVDDQAANIDTLGSTLGDDYQMIVTTNSLKAVELANKHLPDLILLDILMPYIDGYKICSQLKSNQVTQNIPVIFLSALTEPDEVVNGFELGAVDYIQKPFNPAEVKARVNTHIKLVNTQKELIKRNKELELINIQINDKNIMNEDKAEYLANRIKKILANKKNTEAQIKTIRELIPLIATNDLGSLKIVLKVLNESKESLDNIIKDPNEEYFRILSSTTEPLKTAISNIESIIIALLSVDIISKESITSIDINKTSFHEILEKLYVKGMLSATNFEEFIELARFKLHEEDVTLF